MPSLDPAADSMVDERAPSFGRSRQPLDDVTDSARTGLTPTKVARVVGMSAETVSVVGSLLFVTQTLLRLLPSPIADRIRGRCYRALGMDISDQAFLMGNLLFRGGTPGQHRRLHIRAGARISTDVTFNCDDHITIGENVTISPYVRIYTSTHDFGPSAVRCDPVVVRKPVVVERGAWVALGAMLLPGVTVGAGAVVAAGAVVTRDVPADTMVGGVPAEVLRQLP